MNVARSWVCLAGAGLLVASGCTAARPTGRVPAASVPSGAHDLSCQFVGLEAAQGVNDANSDAVTLVAVYRLPDGASRPARAPLSLKFEVTRSRVDELRDHLASQREVICSPDQDANYRVRVEPFHGVTGVPMTPAPRPPP